MGPTFSWHLFYSRGKTSTRKTNPTRDRTRARWMRDNNVTSRPQRRSLGSSSHLDHCMWGFVMDELKTGKVPRGSPLFPCYKFHSTTFFTITSSIVTYAHNMDIVRQYWSTGTLVKWKIFIKELHVIHSRSGNRLENSLQVDYNLFIISNTQFNNKKYRHLWCWNLETQYKFNIEVNVYGNGFFKVSKTFKIEKKKLETLIMKEINVKNSVVDCVRYRLNS